MTIDELADELLDACRGLISRAVAEQAEVLKAAMVEASKAAAADVVRALPVPQDGKSVDPAEVERMVSDHVSKAVGGLAPVVNNVAVDVAEVRSIVAEEVADAVRALPVPQDGKPVDPAEVERMVGAEVERAIAKIPPPREVDMEQVRQHIGESVRAAVAGLPAPRDGKDVDLDDVRSMVADEVKSAVSALPSPKDGRDADPGEIERIVSDRVAKAVADLPKPLDGRDADMAEIERQIGDLVKSAVAEIPPAAPGKDADPEMVRAAVGEAVRTAVEALPAPADGLSAYQIAQQRGFEGGEDEWLESLRGRTGKSAYQVAQKHGFDGPEDDWVRSLKGRDGSNLADPAALLASILPSIDLKSSYRLGTLAKHAGGLVMAERQTAGDGTLSGWSVLANGIADLDMARGDGQRSLILRATSTDGVCREFEVEVPTLIYRGTFSVDEGYEPGDIVTYRGSSWHCNSAVKGRVPGTSGDWTLMVKSGK